MRVSAYQQLQSYCCMYYRMLQQLLSVTLCQCTSMIEDELQLIIGQAQTTLFLFGTKLGHFHSFFKSYFKDQDTKSNYYICMESSNKTKNVERELLQTAHTLRLENFRLGEKYLIFDLIGVGKHSAVYYGIDEQSKEERAFKFYNLKELESVKSFKEKEICKRLSNYQYKIMKQCKSINILKCLDIYQDRNYKVMVYEYCPMTLQDQIDKREDKQVTEVRAILTLKQILNALKSLHIDAQILHTNIQAKNIFIKNGVYRLSDIGLPSIIGCEQSNQITYAPQIIMKKSYDQRAQTWTIGLLFHQILYGQLPWAIKNQDKSVLLGRGNQSIYQFQKYSSSRKVKQFLHQCLRVDCTHRLQRSKVDSHQMFNFIETNQTEKQSKIKMVSPPKIQLRPSNSNRQVQSNKMSVILAISENNMLPQQIEEMNQIFLDKLYEQSFNMDVIRKLIEKDLEQQYQKYGDNFTIQELERTSIQFLRRNINRKQSECYLEIKQYYLECLKVEFIYEQIVVPLINYQSKGDRYMVQLIYMIVTSCFTAMSRLSFEENKKQNNSNYQTLMQNCLFEATSTLYKTISMRQSQYASLLNQIQNKMTSMIFDGFKKFTHSKKLEEKDKYLNGLQTLDFQRKEKIHFTTIFGAKMVKKLEGDESIEKAIEYFKLYQNIWNISLNDRIDEKYPTLKSYIDKNKVRLQAKKNQNFSKNQDIDKCD